MCHVGIEGTKHEIYITSLLNLISILKKTYTKVEVFFFSIRFLVPKKKKKSYIICSLMSDNAK